MACPFCPSNAYLHIPPPFRIRTQIVDGVSAERTRVLVAGLEPLVQTSPVEEVLAGPALLVGHLLIAADDAVADGTLGLTFHGANDVASESCQTVDDTPTLHSY